MNAASICVPFRKCVFKLSTINSEFMPQLNNLHENEIHFIGDAMRLRGDLYWWQGTWIDSGCRCQLFESTRELWWENLCAKLIVASMNRDALSNYETWSIRKKWQNIWWIKVNFLKTHNESSLQAQPATQTFPGHLIDLSVHFPHDGDLMLLDHRSIFVNIRNVILKWKCLWPRSRFRFTFRVAHADMLFECRMHLKDITSEWNVMLMLCCFPSQYRPHGRIRRSCNT